MSLQPSPRTIDHKISILEEVRSRQAEILRRDICGSSLKDISLEMGLSLSQVIQVVNSPLYKEDKSRLQKRIFLRTIDLQERVNHMTVYALEKQFTLSQTARSEHVQLEASELICQKSDTFRQKGKGEGGTPSQINIAQVIIQAYEGRRALDSSMPEVLPTKGTHHLLTQELDISLESVVEAEPEPEPDIVDVENSLVDRMDLGGGSAIFPSSTSNPK